MVITADICTCICMCTDLHFVHKRGREEKGRGKEEGGEREGGEREGEGGGRKKGEHTSIISL